jgi:hypothetical protein
MLNTQQQASSTQACATAPKYRADIKAACEAAFQNGSGRHQVRNAAGALQWDAAESKRDAIAYAALGQVVWSRSKVRCESRYDWKAVRVA